MRSTNIPALIIWMGITAAAVTAQGQRPVATTGKGASTTPAGQAPRTIDIIGNDQMQYSIKTITAKPGEVIRIRVISRGTIPKVAMAHNVVVLKPGTDINRFLTVGAPHRATDFIAPEMKNMVIAQTPFAGPGEAVPVL